MIIIIVLKNIDKNLNIQFVFSMRLQFEDAFQTHSFNYKYHQIK